MEEHYRFSAENPILGATEREHIYAQITRSLAQRLAERHGGVGNARAIHVQVHVALVGKTGQGTYLFWLVNRAHLGALRNRNNAGLRVVLVANAMVGVADGIQRDLAVLMGQWNQLAAGVLLRRAAFVAVDVGIVAAQDRLKGLGQGLQTQNVGSRAVESEENCDAGSKMFLKLFH